MQRYQCHTIVEAAKIVRTEAHCGGDETLYFDPPVQPIRVGVTYVEKHRPEAGGYYVRDAAGCESWSPTTAFEAGYTRVALVGFTADQLRELTAIATADPGTVEDIYNRWVIQQVKDGWHFGNTATAANVSSYLRVFHELAPEQQGLLVHELSGVASVPDGRRRLAATGGDLPDDFETN